MSPKAASNADGLVHRIEIEAVVTRYATALDTKDYKLLRSCFTDDFTARYRTLDFSSPDELCEYMEVIHRYIDASQHRLTNMVIDLDGNRATTKTYVEALLVRVAHAAGPRYAVYGQYDDELAYSGASWRIRRRRFSEMWSHGQREKLIAK